MPISLSIMKNLWLVSGVLALLAVLVHARRVTVRNRRLARPRRVAHQGTLVVSLDAARAA